MSDTHDEGVGAGTPPLDDPVEAAGGSAPPDAPGPGSGTAAAGTALTGAAQSAANDVFDGLQGFTNHVFDAGEAALQDALKVVDAAQTGVSNITSVITAKATGGEGVDLPTIPTEVAAGALTGEAQRFANKLLNGLQVLTNEVYDLGEEGIEEGLKLVDKAQQEVTRLFSKVANVAAGRIGGPPKG